MEIEFAINLSTPPGEPKEFGFLQLRPLAGIREVEAVEIEAEDLEGALCESPSVLGNGRVGGVYDVIMVDQKQYHRSQAVEAALQEAYGNARGQRSSRCAMGTAADCCSGARGLPRGDRGREVRARPGSQETVTRARVLGER